MTIVAAPVSAHCTPETEPISKKKVVQRWLPKPF
jgi:hypothetical protein